MLVIGIDPGLAITGYGLIKQEEETDQLKAVNFGVIHTDGKTPISERLLQIYSQLNEILSIHRPDEAAVEKLFFQKNVRTAINVGQGRGVAILTLANTRIPIIAAK